MTLGLFDYPQKAAFGRVLPKSKVYTFGKVTRRLRDLFAKDVEQVVWRYKLAPETINLPSGPGVAEIQVFGVELKPGVAKLTLDLLECIDHAIAFPIIFEVTVTTNAVGRIKTVAAFKRPSDADSAKWVVGEYFSTEWMSIDTMRSPLPVALNLTGLYEQMIQQLIPIGVRTGESLQSLAERCHVLAMKKRELQKLEVQLDRERQFNRRVALNSLLRTIKAEVAALADAQKH